MISGGGLVPRFEQGCAVLAVSVGMLLAVGIHNDWDITLWTIMRRR